MIQVPSSDDYPSLNLSHAVQICAYELLLAAGDYEPPSEDSPPATADLRQRMLARWERMLLSIGFMDAETAEHMMAGVRRIFSRGTLTDRDVRILLGIAQQADWCAEELRKHREFS